MGSKRMNKAQRKAVHEGLKKFLSVLLSLAMVLQTSPVAYARWDEGVDVVPQEETVPTEEQVEEVAPEEEIPEAPAEGPAPVVEAEPMAEPDPEPAPEVQEQPVAVPAIASLAIENLTTDSVLASSTQDNHLKFKVTYEGLEAGASYKLVLEPMDRRTPEAAQAQQVLLGEPYYIEETDEWRQDPFTWTSDFAPAAATGEQEIELKKVDLHWVAGAAYALRATLYNANGEPVVQRVFDGEYDAKLYVPGIAAVLHAADGTQQLAAENEAAALTDAIILSGLPKNTDISVGGALATAEETPMAVAAGSTTVTTDEWGNATTDLNYPAFAAQTLAGKQLRSTLTITVLDRYGNQQNIATYPSPQGKARKDEPAAQIVAVAEAVPAEAEPAQGEEGTGEESDDPDADPAKTSETEEPAAPVELDPNKPLEEQLDPLTGNQNKTDASVAYGEGDTSALVLEGEAATDPAKAVEILGKKVGRGEALMLVSKLGAPMVAMNADGIESNAPALDNMSEGLTTEDREADDTNIEDLQVKWITEDQFDDDEISLLSLRPGMVDGRNDAYQSVVAQIDYSVSGEKDYEAGDLRIMVPATLFTTRDGKQAGAVVIPYSAAPSKNTEFNWTLVDGYYVFENTQHMNAATKGYIQIMWANLRPHEIADAFANFYDDGDANKGANEEASYITGENQTKDWYAYMEVTTHRGNTIKAVSNTINAQMDTGETINAGYKRVTSNSPYTMSASELPAGSIPEAYADETKFVVVDWYTYARYRGNQPFTLDIQDQLSVIQDTVTVDGTETPLEKPGFIFAIDATGEEETYSDSRDTINAKTIYSGWPNLINGETAYVHVYSAYPYSQFTAGPQYLFHNEVTYTLNPIDGKDTPTVVTARAQIPFSLHESSFIEPPGHFNVFKWGNDGWEDQATWNERDYIAHNPARENDTISRRGYRQHYNGWYGIYEDAINQLAKGEDVTLWYTIKTEGWVLPWTLYKPEDATKSRKGVWYDGYQWAKWNEETNRYEPRYYEDVPDEWFDAITGTGASAEFVDGESSKEGSLVVDTTKTDGYDLVEFYRIQENYLKRPVTMITTDNGLWLDGTIKADGANYQRLDGGTKLTPGVDYVFDYLEFDKPEIGDVVGINIQKGEEFSVSYSEDGTFDYQRSYDDSKIPAFDVYVQVDGVWQSEPYATVDWSSGSPVITSAGEKKGATLKLPANTTNFQTNSTTTENAYFMEWIYPGVTLTDNGEEKLIEAYSKAKFGDEDNPIYQPKMWVQNGVKMDVFQHGTIEEWDSSAELGLLDYLAGDPSSWDGDVNYLLHLEKYGEDRLDGYTGDMGVYPSKEADFDQITDVDYDQRIATVHYTAKVEERTFITDEETYNKLVEDGTITKETSGIWYDLLPKGMTPVMDSVKLREDDNIKIKRTVENWNNTGRTMLIVEADLTPTPVTYKQSSSSAVKYWEDVPTITFDAVMDLDTWTDMGGSVIKGITSHNVVAFESTSESVKELGTLGTLKDHKGEPDKIDRENGNNERTRRKTFTDEEVEAFENLDESTDDPFFVYADCTTQLAFPTAARTSLFKNIMVNEDGRWSQGTYDDVRTVWEGGFYSYRLRMMSSTGTKSKNLVLYDTLENYYAVDGNDDADINAPRWRGEFLGLDLSQITDMGCAPVVYYSTVENLVLTDPDNARRSNAENIDITNSDIWTPASEYTGEPKDVHAIAIDCTKTTEGEDFVLESGNTLTAIIKMHAPWGTEQWDDFSDVTDFYQGSDYSDAHGSARDYIKADAHAYNNVYLVSTSIDSSSPWPEDSASTLDFIRHDYTKVGLMEYSIPVTKEWDDDNNRDGIRPDSIEVTLYANGEPAGTEIVGSNGNTRELSVDNDWTNSFDNVPYTDANGQKIYYTVVETPAQTPEGYVARVSGSVADGFIVNNKHIPEKTRVEGTKTWEADEDDPSTRPSYIIVKLFANGKLKESVRVEPDADGNWPTYSFEGLFKYEEGEEIKYTVEEQIPTTAYTSATQGFDLINTYHPKGDVSITKKVSGATKIVANKSYEFQVVIDSPIVDEEGKPVTDEEGNKQYEPLQDEFAYESSTGATGTVKSGDKLTLVGDEKVTIKELPHGTRVTFTESEYPGFTSSGEGIVSTTVQQNRERALTMTNTYRTSGKVSFKAHKNLTGAQLKNNKFSFEVVDNATGKRVMPASNRADGSVNFGEITYSNKDDGQTYTYTIREIVPDEAVKTLDDESTVTWAEATDEQKADGGFVYKGYTYDSTTYYTATVTLKDNGEGELNVQTVYTDAEGNVVEEPEFNIFENTYEAKGETSMTAWKVLDDGGVGRPLKNEEFTFELTPVKGTDAAGKEIAADKVPMPKDADGNTLNPNTKTNDEKGVIRFDKIEYTQDDAGNTYYYAVREVPGDDPTVNYSNATYGYKVTVIDNGDGTLTVSQGNVHAELETVLTWDKATSDQKNMYNWMRIDSFGNLRVIPADYEGDMSGATYSEVSRHFNKYMNQVFGINFTNSDVWSTGSGSGGRLHINYAYPRVNSLKLVEIVKEYYPDFGEGGIGNSIRINMPESESYLSYWRSDFNSYSRSSRVVAITDYENIAVSEEPSETIPVFTNTLKSGGLSIEKAIQGEGADPSQEFTFHVKLTGDKVDPNGVYTYDLEQVANSTSNDADATQDTNSASPLSMLTDFFTPTTANAEAAYSGTFGTNGSCTWELDEDGTLTLRPTDGVSGSWTLGSNQYSAYIPWSGSQYPTVINIKTEGTIVIKSSASSRLFSIRYLTNAESSLKTADLTGLDVSNIKSLESCFSSCSELTSVNLSNWDTSNVTKLNHMFNGCKSLTSIEGISDWDVSNVTTIAQLFDGCSSLSTIDLNDWDVSSVDEMLGVFRSCSSLIDVNVKDWNLASVGKREQSGPYYSAGDVFAYCKSLKSLDLSGWNPPLAYGLYDLFNGCESLEYLDIRGLDIAARCVDTRGMNLGSMMSGCKNLKHLVLGEGFRFKSKATYSSAMPPTPSVMYTGKWIHVDDDGNQIGTEALTPQELQQGYDGSQPGHWVWQPATLVIHFDRNGGEGTMEDLVLEDPTFEVPDLGFTNGTAEFLYWSNSPNVAYPVLDYDAHSTGTINNSHEVQTGDWDGTTHRAAMTLAEDGKTFEITLYAYWKYFDYTIDYKLADGDAAAGASGSMASVTTPAAEDYTLPSKSSFYWFKHVQTGWDVSAKNNSGGNVTLQKTHYNMGETITADTFQPGYKVTLTPTWADVDTSAQANNGEFTITLHGGERAIFNDLPAGTAYEVWEETESGWKLIKVVDSEGVIQPTEISAAEFTNEYVEIDREAKQTLSATKMLLDENGEQTAVTAGQFRFRLYDAEGNLLQTVSNDEQGNINFNELTFYEKGEYKYTIEEVKGSEEDIDYDSRTITAVINVTETPKLDEAGEPVKDDEDNIIMELVAGEPTYSLDPAQFENKKIEVKHVSHTLTVEKIAEGVSADNSPTFTFEVTLTEGNGKPLEAGTVVTVNGEEKTLSAGGKITVTISEFDENGKGSVDIEGLPEGTLYSVQEIDVPNGWAMTEIDGEGTLSKDESATFTAEVTNKYEVSGLVKLEAEKKFEGGDITDGQFEFGLYADAACTEQLQVAANGVLDETKGTAKVVFAPFTVDAAGDYTYYIKEIVPSEDDPAYDETVQYSDEVITATVVAKDTKHNGTLDVEVTYSPDTATVTNTKKPGKLAINKEVLYAGADKANTAFPIVISLTDDNGVALEGSYLWTSDRAGVEGGTVASGDELQIHGDETITITGLPEGAKYEVIEGEVEDFTLTDSENTEGDIVSNETATAKLVNTFIMGTSATLEAHKTLKGGTLVAGAFTFQLLDSDGNVISEATNNDGGNVTFDELSYGFADADKVFTYTIKEEAKNAGGVVYDTTEYGATVSVTKTAAGTLEAEVAYNKGDVEVELPEFVNTYTADGSYTPTAFKMLEGHDLTKGQFTFKVSRPNGAPLSSFYNPRTETDDNGNQNVIPAVVELTATNDAEGKVVFDPIMFTQDDAGKTITYIVTEVDDQQEGTTYDEHSYRIDVTVADNGDGTLSTTAKSYVDGKPVDVDTEAEQGRGTFYNKYHEPAQGEIKVEKVLDGLDWSDETQFTFTLTADKGNPDATAMPETKSLTIDKNTASHTKSFGTFKINKAGSYRYYVQETKGDIRGLEYDTTRHAVDINVIEDGDGNLVAAQGSNLVQTETITNTYTAVTNHLEVTKEFTGRDWKPSDAFTFSLEAVTEGAPMPDEDGRTATATTRQKTAAFGDIEFFEAGTYEYKITENPGQLGGVTYNADNHSAIITVGKAEGSSKLEVKSITYDGKKTDSLTITNTYAANGSVKLSATKSVTDDGWPEGAEFTFELRDADGNVKDTKTATKGEGNDVVVTFDEIKYENFKEDDQTEYTYTINEVVPGTATNADGIAYSAATDEQKAAGGFMQDGITYSTKVVEVKVTLSDNTDGTLATAVTADGTAVTARDDGTFKVGEFENKAFKRTAKVELNKLLYGEDGAVAFRMTPAGATAAQKATAQGDTYVYSPTQFVEWTADVKPGEVTKVESPELTFYERGTYELVIEEPNAPEGYDEATILATITISDAQDATVSYKISKYDGAEYEDVDGLATLYNNENVTLGFRSAGMRKFNNRYLVTAFQPEIRKVLESGTVKAGEFTFELRDAEGNIVSTATNDENGLVRFDAIRYERSAAANAVPKEIITQADGTETFTYTITEKAGNEAAIVYSGETIGLTVTVSEQDGDLVATGEYSQAPEVGKAPEPTEVPTITNHYDTVKIHAVKYSREDLERGIKTPLANAHYSLWMANPDGADVLVGTQTSDAEGNLWYDIPSIEGVAYYLKESAEHEPPAGHLVDPYPTDWFTLVITDEGTFDLVYEYEYESQEEFMKFVASRAQA